MKVAIIGGGAAGFFAALSVKEHHPKADVTIYEKSKKLLSKVKVSGGGRCNVTNVESSIKKLTLCYPRGGKTLKKLFPIFSTKETIAWFENRGVPLMVQEDGCIFPVSQDSQSIIDVFLSETSKHAISIQTQNPVTKLEFDNYKWTLHFKNQQDTPTFDKVIVATGGSPKRSGLEWLENLGHKIIDPVPSLFTFNMPSENIVDLMGIVVEKTITTIEGTSLKSDGPLLITHWGMSGPSILKLSAFGARILCERDYKFDVIINWANEQNQEVVLDNLHGITSMHGKKQLANYRPFGLPNRLWLFLLAKVNLSPEKIWDELGKKGINALVRVLCTDRYQVEGKTTFKEEFVTCGGVSLESINTKTMQSNVLPNLYFTGEVLDIDAITGGYNFQGAWTTAYIAGMLK